MLQTKYNKKLKNKLIKVVDARFRSVKGGNRFSSVYLLNHSIIQLRVQIDLIFKLCFITVKFGCRLL